MADVARWITASEVINRAAVEVGLNPVNDPYAAQDANFQSFRYLLNSSGQELVQEFDANIGLRTHSFTTKVGDTGIYDLPDDFSSMVDQTQWQKGTPSGAAPLLGPASAQWWSYLNASQLYSVQIYAWFRVKQGKLHLWPQPPPPDIPVSYEYHSRAWVKAGDGSNAYRDTVKIGADVILYEPLLIVRKLKLAFLQAKGFDTTKAEDEFMQSLDTWKGKDQPAPILSLDRRYPGTKFMDGYTSVPDTGYGPP